MSPSEQLRIQGKSPVLDLGTVARIKAREIQVYGEVASIADKEVTFVSGDVESFDTIVCCTGYAPNLSRLIPNILEFCDERGCPLSLVGFGNFKGLYFIGLDNYRTQGILANINTDSKTIVEAIASK